MTETKDTTLKALINLLDEPDDNAFGVIREQIVLRGPDAILPLEIHLENSFNPVVEERTRSLIRELRRSGIYSEFVNWLAIGSSDLLKGFFLVSKVITPSIEEQELVRAIEQIRMDIWVELHENLTALENIKVMNHLLFEIHHFEGNKSDITEPDNNCLHTLLEGKKGSPLSLGILFIILARRLGMPVYGVNLPRHFLLAYLTEPGIEDPVESDVLFYINPFNLGAIFTRREIEIYLRQMKMKPDLSFFTPCSNPGIIQRLIRELIFAYEQNGETEKGDDLKPLLTAFE